MTRRESMFHELKELSEEHSEDTVWPPKVEPPKTLIRDPREYKRMFSCEFVEDHFDGH
jgi:hypothetical protein